jgi:hypothetical protein
LLRIDRVKTEMEVLPREGPSYAGSATPGGLVAGQLAYDPALKERLRDVVLEVLREHFRQLERRGTV